MICGTAEIRFLSTPSGWRATFDSIRHLLTLSISIHALRVEGDLCELHKPLIADRISIHALRVEGDRAG